MDRRLQRHFAMSSENSNQGLENPNESGKVRGMVLLWALGVPIPIILIIMAVRGCM